MSDVATKRMRAARTKAEQLVRDARTTDAKVVLRDALSLFTTQADQDTREAASHLWYALGECEDRDGDLERALEAWRKAEETLPASTEASLRIVERVIDGKGAVAAEMAPHYLRYLAIGRSARIRFGALRRLATILHVGLGDKRSDVTWRMEMLRRINDLDQTINFPKLYLARGHYVRGEFVEAVPYLSALVKDDVANHHILNLLGRCQEKSGDAEGALSAYRKSLAAAPDQGSILFRAGRIELFLAQED